MRKERVKIYKFLYSKINAYPEMINNSLKTLIKITGLII